MRKQVRGKKEESEEKQRIKGKGEKGKCASNTLTRKEKFCEQNERKNIYEMRFSRKKKKLLID